MVIIGGFLILRIGHKILFFWIDEKPEVKFYICHEDEKVILRNLIIQLFTCNLFFIVNKLSVQK